jgi:SAM-dependent methyltransferase
VATVIRAKRSARRERRDFKNIRREARDSCWCGGRLDPFPRHESYGVCSNCGCYVNRRPPAADDLARVYSLDLYWRRRQTAKGFPPIERRGALYRQDGRLDRWLELIEKYGPDSGQVVEIGCAPGILLEELQGRNFTCTGVEISEPVAEWMRDKLGIVVRSGFFPGVGGLPPCNLFLAFDVLEHSPCPDAFICEAANLLSPGGVAIVQTPVDRYDFTPPFGDRFDMFDDLEHLFLFSDRGLELMAQRAGLRVVSLDERVWLAGEIAVFEKPGLGSRGV